MKLSPYYSAMASFAARVIAAGAAGLVLFNRFYQPDLDLETMDVVPRVELSRTWELRLPLRWIAILRPQLGPGPSLAATSGVHTGSDVVKALAVGADVAMMTSAILRFGPCPRQLGRVRVALLAGRARLHLGRPSFAARCPRRPRSTPARSSGPTT